MNDAQVAKQCNKLRELWRLRLLDSCVLLILVLGLIFVMFAFAYEKQSVAAIFVCGFFLLVLALALIIAWAFLGRTAAKLAIYEFEQEKRATAPSGKVGTIQPRL